ncbi:hypothetical protein ACFL3I_06755 [Pseudomonadota bacterium]
MKTRNYGDTFNSRFNDVFPWVVAIDAYDYNDREPLALLLESEPVPDELRPVIVAIESGDRKPNLKAAVKLKIPANERMKIAGTISAVLMLIDTLKFEAIDESVNDLSGVSMLAEQVDSIREPAEIMRELEYKSRKVIAESAEQLGVSVETIENLLRQLRQKMERYPNI